MDRLDSSRALVLYEKAAITLIQEAQEVQGDLPLGEIFKPFMLVIRESDCQGCHGYISFRSVTGSVSQLYFKLRAGQFPYGFAARAQIFCPDYHAGSGRQ